MENQELSGNNPCKLDCDYQIMGTMLSCVTGTPTCNLAEFIEAEESEFHDANLIKATWAIKAILAAIPEDQNGRNLSLLNTKKGLLLAWVEHGGTPIKGAVTSDSDIDSIASALKLK